MKLYFNLKCPHCKSTGDFDLEYKAELHVDYDGTCHRADDEPQLDFDHGYCHCSKCDYEGFIREFVVKE